MHGKQPVGEPSRERWPTAARPTEKQLAEESPAEGRQAMKKVQLAGQVPEGR